MPIKRLVLDEAQLANTWAGTRYKALRALYYNAAIILSGTLAHNSWQDISGYLYFLQGHQITSESDFIRMFSSSDYDEVTTAPSITQMGIFQKLLRPMLIARPPSTIQLTPCARRQERFDLPVKHKEHIEVLIIRYHLAMSVKREDGKGNDPKKGKEGKNDGAGRLGLAIQALMLSLHPLLFAELKPVYEAIEDDDYEGDIQDRIQHAVEKDAAATSGKAREDWLKRLSEEPDLLTGANRLRRFLEIFKELCRTKPDEKMVIFSPYIRHLDIMAQSLERCYAIKALRYDGTVKPSKRVDVEKAFQQCSPQVSLLITAGSGSVGLNIPVASVVIILEPPRHRQSAAHGGKDRPRRLRLSS